MLALITIGVRSFSQSIIRDFLKIMALTNDLGRLSSELRVEVCKDYLIHRQMLNKL